MYTKQGFTILDTDCISAFDCCIPEIIQLGLLLRGWPEITATFLYNHLMNTEFNVTAGGFTPKDKYGGPQVL